MGGGYSTRLFCCVWASRVSGTCEPCMPTLAWAAGILHVRKLMRLFSCKTQFKPHNSWQFGNEAAWTPVFFFSPPLFTHLSLDTVIFILQLEFVCLTWRSSWAVNLQQKWKLRTEHNQNIECWCKVQEQRVGICLIQRSGWGAELYKCRFIINRSVSCSVWIFLWCSARSWKSWSIIKKISALQEKGLQYVKCVA